MSVDGATDHRGALVHLSHDSPGTITEETPTQAVAVPLSHQLEHSPMDVARLDLGRDRAQDQVLAQEQTNSAFKLQT